MKFTGERFVPGKTSKKIEDDHFARYEFACQFVKGKKVLDIACGVGYGSQMMSNAGALHVDGVDISDDTIEYATRNYLKPNVSFMQGDICYHSVKNKYDLIVCFETIEHVPNYRLALKNLKKMLFDDGKLIISSPNRIITSPKCHNLDERPSRYHYQEFTIFELRQELINCGFSVENNAYGQRQQYYLPNRLLRWLYDIYFKPYRKFSPKVTLIKNKEPRYFVLIANAKNTIPTQPISF